MFPNRWTRSTIGELCEMVKGDSQIVRTKPGPYPLVTTGEGRKTADRYQFDRAAVCVPMISAYGHGKAGLKRIQYQEGNFALANILTALLVRDISKLTPRFLHLFLDYYKDQLIVPLQTGVANMALTIAKLATVPVAFPLLDEQHRIVSILDEVETLRQLRARADERMAEFIPALFNQMFGDPAMNPKGWPVKHMRDIGIVTTGNTPPTKYREYYGDAIEWIKSDNINTPSHILTRATAGLSEKGKKIGRAVPPGSVLVTCIAGSRDCIGNAALADREVAFNQQINAVTPHPDIDPFFLYCQILSLKPLIQLASSGGMKGIVSKTKFELIPVIIPPEKRQNEFGVQFKEALHLLDQQAHSRARLEAGFQALLHRAFNGSL